MIARPDGTPTYNFCVCVDDMDMQITDVIRGDDHATTRRAKIHIFEVLGAQVPAFADLPTVLNEQGEEDEQAQRCQGRDAVPRRR